MRPAFLLIVMAVALPLGLAGCDGGHAYRKKGGDWYFHSEPVRAVPGEALTELNSQFAKGRTQAFYQSSAITGADPASFAALGDHYAKDQARVWFCSIRRDGKEYFTVKHPLIQQVAGADPATFQVLSDDYARDKSHVFYRAETFPVKDLASFELLAEGFARDKVSGYYQRTPIPGSDGASFSVIDGHYSKDANHVFYSDLETAAAGEEPRTVVVRDAQPASFMAQKNGYGGDGSHAFYQAKALTTQVDAFRVLDYGYAKTRDQVFYYGEVVPLADPTTFDVLDPVTETATAKDKNATYKDGKRSPIGRGG
jgi:hypothetical protein